MFHDLPVDEEEDFNLVLRKVGVDVLVVELNRGIEQRLPGFF